MVFHRTTRILASATLAGAAATIVSPSCTVTEPTEFVPGISTQVRLPKDLAGVTIALTSGGTQLFCNQYPVFDGRVTLPGTLGVFHKTGPTEPLTITVRGYTEAGLNGNSYFGCTGVTGDPSDYSQNPRVLRRSTLSFVDQKTIFLPLPLKFACFDQTACTDTQTCKGGACVDATLDAGSLPIYEPGMGDGTSPNCFDPKACFLDRAPAFPVDLSSCTFTFPIKPPGTGMNVQVFYGASSDHQDGGSDYQAEYLDQDPDEGFIIDPNNPTQFTLAPGLCASFQNYLALQGVSDAGPPPPGSKYIYDVEVASACAPKSLAQPICAAAAESIMVSDAGATPLLDASCTSTANNVLKPDPGALLVLLDRRFTMSPLFGASAFQRVLSFSLGAPAFSGTEVGLKFVPTANNVCTSPNISGGFIAPNDIGWESATAAQKQIATAVSSYSAVQLSNPVPPIGLDGLLAGSTGVYNNFRVSAVSDAGVSRAFNRKAVLLVTNTDIQDDCAGDGGVTGAPAAAAEAAAALKDAGIYTYVIELGDPFDAGAGQTYPGANAIADAGGTKGFVDGTKGATAAGAFTQVIGEMSTCLYTAPSPGYAMPDAGSGVTTTLSYTQVALSGTSVVTQLVPIAPDPTCTSATQATSDGWALDNGQIRICGTSCQNVRDSFMAAANLSLLSQASSIPDIPVVLQTTSPCP